MTLPDQSPSSSAGSLLPRFRRGLLVSVLLSVACAFAVLLAEHHAPRPPALHEHDFILKRPPGVSLRVDPGKPADLPYPFVDVDLYADLILDNGAELELAFRRVEPVQREGGIEPFHARYGLLRLSTMEAGDVVYDRDDALLRDEPLFGGHYVVPGEKVSVALKARGRTVTVNLGGVEYGPIETADAHGAFAFVAHHAGVDIPFLEIRYVPRPLRLLPIGWAALVGALLGFLAGLGGRITVPRLAGLLAVPALAWLGGGLVLAHLADESEVSTIGELGVALAGLPLAVLWILRPAWWTALLGVVLAALCFESAVRSEARRIPLLEDPRLAALLGPDSGPAAFDVLVPRLRAPSEVFRPKQDTAQVVFLGGAPVWEAGREPEEWVAQLAMGKVRAELGRHDVETVVAGTIWANLRQQILLLERLMDAPWWPEAVVLGVAEWEGEPAEDPRVVAALDAAFAEPRGEAPPAWSGSALWSLWSAAHAARDEPAQPTTAENVGPAMDRLLARLAEEEIPLLVVAAKGLDPGIATALEAACAAVEGARFEVVEGVGRDPEQAVTELTPLLIELLRE